MEKLLNHDETLALISLSQTGDMGARTKLTECNIALVKSIVRGYMGRGTEFDDLMQIGTVGLLKAIDGYDPKFGVRFSTYAVPMIAGEIKRFLRDDGIIKVSRSVKENAAKIYRAQEKLKSEFGRDPTIDELAGELDMPEEDIIFSMDAVRDPVSLSTPIFDDGGKNAELADIIADDGKDISERLLLKQLIAELPPREKKLIMLRFFGDKTQSEIAEILNVSQVQVSRLLTKTLEKMRKSADK